MLTLREGDVLVCTRCGRKYDRECSASLECIEKVCEVEVKDSTSDMSVRDMSVRDMSMSESEDKAKTEVLEFDLTQIPLESLIRVGRVFKEGEKKYGKDNWLKGVKDVEYQIERCNHAIKHLYEYVKMLRYRDRSREDDLAKVMWFCCTQIEIERLEEVEIKVKDSTSGW